MNIGHRIKQRRKELKMSADTLGKRLGKDRSTIYRYENGDIENLPLEILEPIAKALETTPQYLMGWIKEGNSSSKGYSIPVLSYVRAGIPIEAVEDILDYEEISQELANTGDFFALKIKGDSMEPRITDGDVVIVRKQEQVKNGELAVVLVNGNDATVKRFYMNDTGVTLISSNSAYPPFIYSKKDVMELPVRVIGKVVELRAKF